MNKVWIVTRVYWESNDILGVYDSKEKAEDYVKKIFKCQNMNCKKEDLVVEITYSCPDDKSAADYIITEWDVE